MNILEKENSKNQMRKNGANIWTGWAAMIGQLCGINESEKAFIKKKNNTQSECNVHSLGEHPDVLAFVAIKIFWKLFVL